MPSVDELIKQLASIPVEQLSEADRAKALAATRGLFSRLETPWESILRLVFRQSGEMAALKVCSDLQLFEKWKNNTSDAQSAQQLCNLLGDGVCDPELLERLLRVLVMANVIHVSDQNLYLQTKFSLAFADSPAYSAALRHYASSHAPVLHSLPDYLAALGYRNPTKTDYPSFQFGMKTAKPLFQWLAAHPQEEADFAQLMKHYAGNFTPWVDIYPSEEIAREQGDHALVVDVGGGMGHDLLHFARKHPEIAGSRLIVQDLGGPMAKTAVTPESGTTMVHNFFEPQPVKGATAYYLHSVLHDWPDEDARQILKHLRDAMDPRRSRVLIHEIVLQPSSPNSAAGSDITMMAMLNARERSTEAWQNLLASEGLQIKKLHEVPQSAKSIIEAIAA